jgi:hypothetical protein
MTIDIFIRTYDKDLEWLSYALKSIHKYVTGHRRIIIAIPQGQGHLLSHLTQETIIEVEDLPDGYLGQQLTKMQAWRHTDADAVVFWDSDVVATRPIDVRGEYFKDGRIILYKTRYSSINGMSMPPVCPWQPITAKAVGFVPEWEYMRRMPLVYWTNTLQMCEAVMEATHRTTLDRYLTAQPNRAFSEFNALGAFAETHNEPGYLFTDTESVDMPPCAVDQMWSWGLITDEVKSKLIDYGLA